MSKILIGCRLPHGLILTHPDKEKRNATVKIAGLRDSKIVGATHITTEVDADFWQAWKTAYHDYAALKNGSLFEADSASEAKAKGKEAASERTGFESMTKDAPGIKPADKE